MRSPLLLVVACATPALAAPLDLDPAALPHVDPPAADGSAWVRFDGEPPVLALPALIVSQDADLPPPHPEAVPLGPSGRSWRVPAASVADAVALGARLRARPGVRAALPDLVLERARTTFDDPRYGSQWYLEVLEMEPLYAVSTGDPDVRVAVVDSAIDLDHPDMAGAFVDPLDAWSDDDDPRPDPGVYCPDARMEICDHHGTSVAGIIGARAGNGRDIVGLCPECTVVPIRMIGPGAGTLGRDVAAFEHAIAADVAVINNSWGFTQAIAVPAPLAEVVRRAATEPRGGLGALVIFAAGNDDREIRADELQAMPEVLTVSATDRYGLPTAYTNRGASVDLAAPSATVTLEAGGGVTTTFGGTSAAAPVVAGLAAWAVSVDPSLSAEDLREVLLASTVPSPLVTHDANGHHPVYGLGEISAARLRDLLAPEPEPEPDEGRACACAHTAPGAAAWIALLALGVAARRRRR